MYTGDKTLSTLNAFLNGAHFSLELNGIKETPGFRKFHCWVQDKFEIEQTTEGYCSTILKQCNGDEEKALEMFFELVEEFKKETTFANNA